MPDTQLVETTVVASADPAPAAVSPASRFDPRLGDRIPGVMALGVALAWVVGLWAVFSLAPAVDPDQPPSLLGIVLGELLTLSLLAGAVGLGMRRRWGLAAALFGGGVLLFGGVACQLAGHTGTWLAAQYVAGGSLAAFSWGGMKAT